MYGENRFKLNILDLRRDGALRSRSSGTISWSNNGKISRIGFQTAEDRNSMRLNYTYQENGGESEDLEYPVRISWSRDAAGRRHIPSFSCPFDCGKPTRELFLVHGLFLCQNCLNLSVQDEADEQKATESRAELRRAAKVLNVPEDAPTERVMEAFRVQAQKWHPDRNPKDPKKSTQKMQELNEALSIFKNHFHKNKTK